MFRDAFEKLDVSDVALIVDEINPLLEEVDFDPLETNVYAIDLSFYPGFKLLEIQSSSPDSNVQCFAVYAPGEVKILNFTNEPIYMLNKSVPIQLNEENISEYIKFFFSYVRGRHGHFLISETVDDIPWREDPPIAARRSLSQLLKPIIIKDIDQNGAFHLNAHMMFKDSLFRSDINVSREGYISLENEELVVEDIPVLDEVLE